MKERARTGALARRANQKILRRIGVLMGIFGIIVFAPLFYKLWQIQIVNHDFYEEYAINQQTRDVAVSADRGTIYDSKGNILAISATVQNVILSPRDMALVQKNYDDKVTAAVKAGGEAWPEPTNEYLAQRLGEILGIDPETIVTRLEKTNSAYEILAKRVEDDVAAQVRELISECRLSNGLLLTPDSKRYYPYATLGAQVLGFVNDENAGAYGLEAVFEDELSGEAGRVITAKNAAGTEMLSNYQNYMDAVDGYDLNLTLDATIQQYAERILEEGIANYEVSNGGFCIVMNPKTGAIYAMASNPTYDLNEPRLIYDTAMSTELEGLKNDTGVSEEAYLEALAEAQYAQWRNKALNDTYEPGSTFKSVVVAAALEEGAVSESSTFFCSGVKMVAGWPIHCHDRSGHGLQTLCKVVMNSCNPSFIEIGQALGAEKFYEYFNDFGIIGTTGIELPEADNSSQVWSEDWFTSEYGLSSLATASFGQRFNLTPIQLITAGAATINGGYLMEPYLVSSVADKNGNIINNYEPEMVRQVVSTETSDIVRSILESVVGDGGTGKNAYEAGYRIGGKTGTSETLNEGRLIVSFLGFAPADDPEIIVLLGYDWPVPSQPGSNYTASGTYISGGNMAAPMAGNLIADILDYMGVDKQYTAEELSGVDTAVPNVVGFTVEDAQARLKQNGLAWRTVGSGTVVTDQTPTPNTLIPKNSQVILYLGEEKPEGLIPVPNLVGKTPEQAQEALAQVGLYLRASGAMEYFSSSTSAASQSIDPETMVEAGQVVEVRFIDENVKDYANN